MFEIFQNKMLNEEVRCETWELGAAVSGHACHAGQLRCQLFPSSLKTVVSKPGRPWRGSDQTRWAGGLEDEDRHGLGRAWVSHGSACWTRLALRGKVLAAFGLPHSSQAAAPAG